MSISMRRDELIAYYKHIQKDPPSKVLEADPEDMFAWGMTLTKQGFGFARLRKIGRMVDGVFQKSDTCEPEKLYDCVSMDPDPFTEESQ